MAISRQAPKGEASETIESAKAVSRVRSKRSGSAQPPEKAWGEDIVLTSWKREAALKKLVSNMQISDKGCWEWQGSTTLGYGCLKLPKAWGNFKIMAHRLSWVAFKGESIPAGLFLCHHCDNPLCFNPDHLFLGTQQDNLQDCSAKGRTMTGSKNGYSKYTKEQIQEVQKLLKDGLTGREVSAKTGISVTHVSRIKRGYTWKSDTASAADLVNGNRKYTDEQVMQAARMIVAGRLDSAEIATIVGVKKTLILDMMRGKAYQRFIERAASSDCG